MLFLCDNIYSSVLWPLFIYPPLSLNGELLASKDHAFVVRYLAEKCTYTKQLEGKEEKWEEEREEKGEKNALPSFSFFLSLFLTQNKYNLAALFGFCPL